MPQFPNYVLRHDESFSFVYFLSSCPFYTSNKFWKPLSWNILGSNHISWSHLVKQVWKANVCVLFVCCYFKLGSCWCGKAESITKVLCLLTWQNKVISSYMSPNASVSALNADFLNQLLINNELLINVLLSSWIETVLVIKHKRCFCFCCCLTSPLTNILLMIKYNQNITQPYGSRLVFEGFIYNNWQ